MNSPLQLPGPRLPLPLALPLRLMASRTHSSLLAKAMNRLLAPELADGELDFLSIRVTDARVEYRLTLASDGLAAAAEQQPEDLSIEGSVYDFLLLATRREDADTLFFNRRLRLGGDTELGLYVKNFIDALELDARLGPLLKLLNGTTGLIGHLA